MTRFQRILVATDFSPTSGHAVELAAGLAKQYGASLTLLHVVEIPAPAYSGWFTPVDLLTPMRDAAEKALADALAELRKQVPAATSSLRMGIAADEVIGEVRDGRYDLVVIGTHGRRGLRHLLLGSVAERVVRTCPVPVLTVRGEA